MEISRDFHGAQDVSERLRECREVFGTLHEDSGSFKDVSKGLWNGSREISNDVTGFVNGSRGFMGFQNHFERFQWCLSVPRNSKGFYSRSREFCV